MENALHVYPWVTEYFSLTSCKTGHPVASEDSQGITERNPNKDGSKVTICPRHRVEHGMFRLPSRKCAHSLHGNHKGKPERGASGIGGEQKFMSKWSTFVPVGAGKGGIYTCLPCFKTP